MKKHFPILLTFFLLTSGSLRPAHAAGTVPPTITGNNIIDNFTTTRNFSDGLQFGTCNALTLETSGAPTLSVISNNYLLATSNAKSDGFIIRSTNSLPPKYKVSVDMGDIEFDLANPQVDLENGLYLPTIVTSPGAPTNNDWWHANRKVHIDIDNNVWGWGGAHPVFFGYYTPASINLPDPSNEQLVYNQATNAWVKINSNWASAFNYQKNTWYTFEIERTSKDYFFRIYDANSHALLKQASIPITSVRSGSDFLVLGDPHTNYYKGNVKVKNLSISNISCSTTPTINSFSANPSTISKGGSSTLSWSTTGATSLSISGIGPVTGNSIAVSPTATTTYTLTAANSGKSVTAQTTVTVNSVMAARIYLEAENASSIVLPLRAASDAAASNGQYIYTPEQSGDALSPGTAVATIPVNITQSGTYVLWGSVIAGSGSNSFFVQIDNGPNYSWDLQNGTSWHWNQVSDSRTAAYPVKFTLTPGAHTIRIKLRKDGTKIDRLFLTNDLNSSP